MFIFFGILAIAMAVYAIFFTDDLVNKATYISVALGIMAFGMGLETSIFLHPRLNEFTTTITRNVNSACDSVNLKIEVLDNKVIDISKQLQDINQRVDAVLTASVPNSSITEFTNLLTVLERMINSKKK